MSKEFGYRFLVFCFKWGWCFGFFSLGGTGFCGWVLEKGVPVCVEGYWVYFFGCVEAGTCICGLWVVDLVDENKRPEKNIDGSAARDDH